MAHPPRPTRRHAFTLIELLAVIAIVIIAMGISFPFLRSMINTSSVQIAANSVSSAVSGARAYSTRDKRFDAPSGSPPQTSQDDSDGYSGAAVIFTTDNTLRIVQNIEDAVDGDDNRLELGATIRNAYADIDELDQIRLPGRVVALGIVRNQPIYGDNNIRLLPPPFAISFNNRGNLQVSFGASTGRRSNGYIYYDANGDELYDHADVTPANIADADRMDRDSFVAHPSQDLSNYRRGEVLPTPSGFNQLAFEQIEPVVGVVLFDVNDLPADVYNAYYPLPRTSTTRLDASPIVGTGASTGPAETILEWAASNQTPGRVLFFNRYTGIDIAR